MKNWKLRSKITLGITFIVLACMSMLYLTVNRTFKLSTIAFIIPSRRCDGKPCLQLGLPPLQK